MIKQQHSFAAFLIQQCQSSRASVETCHAQDNLWEISPAENGCPHSILQTKTHRLKKELHFCDSVRAVDEADLHEALP